MSLVELDRCPTCGHVMEEPDMYLKTVIDAVATYYGIGPSRILTRSREGRHVRARQMAMWMARRAGYSYAAVADQFDRDHTTVMHACKAVDDRIQAEESTRHAVRWLVEELRPG